MVRSGTKTAKGATSGLDYLKSLGVTHVQMFVPMYDYGSVNETGEPVPQRRWRAELGLRPGELQRAGRLVLLDETAQARVTEMKQMVRACTRTTSASSWMWCTTTSTMPRTIRSTRTVPGYFRYSDNGSLVNDSGCGNATPPNVR
ncbi:MAG: hypothetical protein R2683_04215 [Bifidobacterium adolescentis]